MQDQSIRDFFDQYASRIALYNRMTENMLHASSREIWQQAIHHAAAKVSDMYTVNTRDIAQLFTPLNNAEARTGETLTDAQYDLLLEQLMKFYALADHDLFLIYELAKKLLPHFLTKGTTEQLIDVYTCLSYSNIELSRVVHEGYGKRSVEYYAKMISLGETMLGQDCPIVYRRMAVAYINMLITESALCNITMDDAREYWLRLKSLRNGPKYAPFVESVQHATSLMDLTIERFATDAYGIYLNNNKQASPEFVQQMIDMNEEAYQQALQEAGNLLDCDPDMVITHIEMDYALKRSTADEARERLYKYMMEKQQLLDLKQDDIISFWATGLQDLISLLPEGQLPFEEQQALAHQYMDLLEQFIRDYDRTSSHAYSINNALTVLAFLPPIYAYMDTLEDKIRFIYRMVIRRHLSTYLHSQMVAHFAMVILDSVLRSRPDLLIGFHGIASAEEARSKRTQLMRFVRNASLLHDIGKTKILDMVDTQFRPLFDEEFSLIHMHPDMGADLLEVDHELVQFSDIVRGHHRFYNGKGGYPADFDNCASPDKIMIDLITLSDCLDAATDNLGRNYQRAKKVSAVLEEFAAGSGTRYNPDLVHLLLTDAHLNARLCNLAGPERERISANAGAKM